MTELQNLYMNHNNINDLSPLQNAVNLEHLEICGNNSYIGWTSNKLFYNVGFSDISPLKNLTKLKYLDFSGNRVEDISVLAGMPALQKLYFSYNNVRNISALQDLLLQELDCSNNYLEVLWGDTEPLSAAAETIQTLTRRGTTINYSNQDPSHADLSYPQLSAAANNPAGVQVSVAPNDTREIDVLHIKLSLPANASDSCLINSLVFDFSGQEKNGKLIDAAAVNVVSLYREYDYPSGPTEKLGQQKGGSQITFSGLNQLLEPGQTQYYILRYTLDKSDPNNATYGATINPGKIGATSAASGQGLIVRGSAAQGTFFRKGGTLKLDVMPGGSGTVAATPSWTSYGAGDQVTLTATPAPGYVLDYFHNQQNTGETDWNIRQNPAVITVNWTEDAEGKITAIFDKEPTSSDGKKHGKLKDPVNTATGEFYFETPLFDLGGPLPMKSSLYYGSALSGNTDVNSAFGHVIGANWLHNYQMACLHKNDQEAAVIYDRGKTLNFARNGTAWELSDTLDIAYSLKNDSAGNFYLLDPDKELVYIFNTDQRLSRVEDRKGNRHTLTYDTSGNLATVSDGLGRSLNFSYQDTRLAAISDGYGRTWRFGYTGQVLASLTDPMGNVTGFTCSDKAKQGLIATVTCPRGNQPYTQTYDSEGRVIKQTDTYGDVTGWISADRPRNNKHILSRPEHGTAHHLSRSCFPD
jgi:YD repeat-containing protein